MSSNSAPQNKQKSNKQQANAPDKGGKQFSNEKKATGAVPELPVLDFQNRRVDVHHFNVVKNKIKDYIAAKYSRNAHFFDTGSEYEYPDIELPDDPLTDVNDPYGLQRAALKKRMEQKTTMEIQYEENKPMVYAIIWGQCTAALRLRIKQAADYADFDRDKDPLALWLEITKICLGDIRNNINNIVAQYDARKRFEDMWQGNHDKVGAFYEKFLANVEAAKAMGVEFVSQTLNAAGELVNDEDEEQRFLSISFIKKLDKKRFGQLQSKLENDVSLGMDTYPTTSLD